MDHNRKSDARNRSDTGFNSWTPALAGTSYTLSLTVAPIPTTAYWSNTVSTVWNDATQGPIRATGPRMPALTDTRQLPGPITDVYIATSIASSPASMLGADFSIHSLNMPGGTTGPASIGGGNTLTIGAGGINLDAGAGGLTIGTSGLALGTPQTWTNNAANPLTVNSVLSGSGLTTAGSGTVVRAPNTLTGPVTISAGTLQLANTAVLNPIAPNAVAFSPNSTGTLQLAGNSVTIGGLTTDATNPGPRLSRTPGHGRHLDRQPWRRQHLRRRPPGRADSSPLSLAVAGAGTLTLTAANSYSGGTTLSSGTLQLGTGTPGQDGSLASPSITNNAALVYNLAAAQTYSGSIGGSGTVSLLSPVTLTLAGSQQLHGRHHHQRRHPAAWRRQRPAHRRHASPSAPAGTAGTLDLAGFNQQLGGLAVGRGATALPAR